MDLCHLLLASNLCDRIYLFLEIEDVDEKEKNATLLLYENFYWFLASELNQSKTVIMIETKLTIYEIVDTKFFHLNGRANTFIIKLNNDLLIISIQWIVRNSK